MTAEYSVASKELKRVDVKDVKTVLMRAAKRVLSTVVSRVDAKVEEKAVWSES